MAVPHLSCAQRHAAAQWMALGEAWKALIPYRRCACPAVQQAPMFICAPSFAHTRMSTLKCAEKVAKGCFCGWFTATICTAPVKKPLAGSTEEGQNGRKAIQHERKAAPTLFLFFLLGGLKEVVKRIYHSAFILFACKRIKLQNTIAIDAAIYLAAVAITNPRRPAVFWQLLLPPG